MTIKHTLKIAFGGLATNRSRSGLTILGIVIGITSIILMMSIGRGAENLILDQISAMGAETIVIRPGQEPSGPSDIGDTLFADSLKIKDLRFLERKENVPKVVRINPIVIVPGSVSYGGETFRPTIFGSGNPEFWSENFKMTIIEGVLFDDQDVREKASVALIGSKVKEELFGESDAVGEFIRIKDRKFRVMGVYKDHGRTSFFNVNELVIIPYTTAQTYLLGIDYFHEIILETSGPEAVARTVRDIEATLRESHGITDPDKDDFFVVTQQGAVEQIGAIMGALTLFLSSVVAIALVVAGVGVMNIMLVSVTERTREIGLRKAVGATDGDIMQQFLFEAVLLTGVGGIIGIALGALLSFGVSVAITQYTNLDWVFTFPLSAALLGIAVSTLVGLIFGIYPARQAAKKSPIEALRYE